MKILGIETLDGEVHHYKTKGLSKDRNISVLSHAIYINGYAPYEFISFPMQTIRRWWIVDESKFQGPCKS